ncbi:MULTISPECIES: hypothetical protein [Micrococcaceae]|uniref:Acetone carboxylase n=1 Tax=Glutamicibacter ectropisis TaxID=3046593 RepID=A0AAU6WJS3_9MICC|nr:hypothetical protein [Arthrobacter sp. NIO-1057]KSU67839.1 acetone carboxylase [Arthrobacter sp. NIO-1057]SCB80768.1 hypothetical protein GA0061084_0350 [Arthrobacter sp. NIO-1057]
MDLLGSLGQPQSTPEVQCSRKGCRNQAEFQLLWNNPKIHTPERRKIWLACSEHQEWLENYLKERLLYRQTLPLPGTTGGAE